MSEIRHVEAVVHGRYIVRNGPPERLIVGFHGYAETAEIHLGELERIPGIGDWSVAAVQALHPFYVSKGQKIAANWMTRQDRELAIRDNLAYVRRVVGEFPEVRTLVFLGFSQGAAMACRAAAAIPCSGLIALGGDIPPDVNDASALPPMLLSKGKLDEWYTAEKLEKDLRFLANAADVTTCVFDGGHEWSDEFREAAGVFLKRLATSRPSS